MAFDFHIRESFDLEVTTAPACQLDEELHDALFAIVRPQAADFPLLMECEAFSHDAWFEQDEIAALLHEVGTVRTSLSTEGRLAAKLAELENVCRTAISAGKLLHGVAD